MNVGLIAHDSKKKLMQNFCIAYKGILSKLTSMRPEPPANSSRKSQT